MKILSGQMKSHVSAWANINVFDGDSLAKPSFNSALQIAHCAMHTHLAPLKITIVEV